MEDRSRRVDGFELMVTAVYGVSRQLKIIFYGDTR